MAPRSRETVVTIPGLSVVLDSFDPEITRVLRGIFSGRVPGGGGVASPDGAQKTVIEVVDGAGGPERATVTVFEDGVQLYATRNISFLVNYLETLITEKLARGLTQYLLLHSGVVAVDGVAILLPGASGAGKSTSTTCLALTGCDYFSDEMAVCSPDGKRVFPFPKMPSLKSGGLDVIDRAFRSDPPEFIHREPDGRVNYVRVPKTADDLSCVNGAPIGFVIVPGPPEDGETSLTPLKKTDALRVLVEESLDLKLKHAAGFDALANIVDRAGCYSLRMADVPAGAELVRRLVTG